ncbi:MAG: membrane protein insertion efficiency factor YidD [Bacilli bacterium]|nr:membrane protein insertion efficiency factor YidD [Bacilli bacterium]
MKKIPIFFIKLYQATPLHSHSMCRFNPTCSQYMIDAINKYGTIKGIKLGLKRLKKCHPKGEFGYDPVK